MLVGGAAELDSIETGIWPRFSACGKIRPGGANLPYRNCMRIAGVQISSGVLAMLLAAFMLSGCASTPVPTPTSATPTVAPVFATEEEALAAATEAYAAYQELIDRIFSEGGKAPSRIAAVVTPRTRRT